VPITKSAKKAMRVSARRRVFNLRRARTMKEEIKDFKKLVTSGDKAKAEASLPKVYQAIDKAAKRGVIKLNAAARYKSRLTHTLTAKTAK